MLVLRAAIPRHNYSTMHHCADDLQSASIRFAMIRLRSILEFGTVRGGGAPIG